MMNSGPMMNDPMMAGQDPNMGMQQPEMGMPQEPAMEPPSQEEQLDNYLNYAFSETNIAKKLKKTKKGKETLEEIGREICRGYDEDENSRSEWMKNNADWLKMAILVREKRSFPWKDSSNIKYPLMATAAMQFSARAYPALVPSSGEIVKTKVTQKNAPPNIWEAARRISTHMSFQCQYRIPNWEENMDKLLMTMAISGICFKKTFHSKITGTHESCLVYPEKLCVNYHAKNLDRAYRKTEIQEFTDNDIKEKVRDSERFLDVDLTPASNEEELKEPISTGATPPPADKSTPHKFIACHTFWDLDDDGYEEPYIITVHYNTQQVVQIIARWDQDGVKRNEKDEIILIQPVEYFTPFTFIPNPDGSIYGLGFGLLLGPLNESVNSLVNMLVDAGSLSNLQGGFIGTGLRLKMGPSQFSPGEWKVVPTSGQALKDSIFPLPVKEPSAVLFQLMTFLITAGNQLASIAEIFVGKMPGQNTPATTTQETIQQGMAVFTAIYKRVYRSLDQEFRKLYRLNKICPETVEEEKLLSGIELTGSDYALPDWIIMPGADPTGDSTTVKMQKLQQVGQLIQLGTIDPMEFTKRMLDANEIPSPQELMAKPQPPAPDPKMETEKLKQQTMQQKSQLDGAAKQQDMEIKKKLAAIDEAKSAMKLNHEQQMALIKEGQMAGEAKIDAFMKIMEQRHETQKQGMELHQKAAKHEQDQRQKSEVFQQKLQQEKAKPKKAKKPSK